MLIDFLKTKTDKKDLATAFKVLMEFKGNEEMSEYIRCDFVAWHKLEQLQEFLDHLANGEELKKDTLEELEAEDE